MVEADYVQNINFAITEVRYERYLIEVEYIKEIYVPGENIIQIPFAEDYIVGIIDIRGEIYSILSLRHILNKNETSYDLNDNSRLLLIELDNLKFALLVDSVIGVKELPMSIFDNETTIIETEIDYNLIKLIGNQRDDVYIVLDLNKLIESYNSSEEKQDAISADLKPKAQPLPKVRAKIEKVDKSVEIKVEKKESEIKPKGIEIKKETPTTEEKIRLSQEQQDLLIEIGNIGSGNAITALSRLINKKIDVNLTDVGIVSLDNLTRQFGNPKEKVCGIFSHIEPPSQSTILQVFDMKPLMKLIVSLGKDETNIKPNKVKTKEDLDDFAISTITEIGNILAGHYASALADLTETKMMIDIPEFTMSEVGLLEDFLFKELKSISEFVIMIKTSMNIADLKLSGVFFFVPDIDTLRTFFKTLGINSELAVEKSIVPKEVVTIISDDVQLSEFQRDALQEVGNIGAGNAANALAQMINKRVDINIPSVEMVELEKFASSINKSNKKLLVTWSNVVGKARATVLTVFELPSIINLTSIIVGDKAKKKIDLRKKIDSALDIPELYRGAMSELGHILGSHYTSAIGDLLGIRLMTEPPDMSIDNGKQFIEILKEEIGLLKKLSLIITTKVIITDIEIMGTFLFIPNMESLKELITALTRFYE